MRRENYINNVNKSIEHNTKPKNMEKVYVKKLENKVDRNNIKNTYYKIEKVDTNKKAINS